MAQTVVLQNVMEVIETKHPQELGKVSKGRQRMFAVVHDLIVCSAGSQGKHQPSSSNGPDLKYYLMVLNVPSSLPFPLYLLIYYS